MRIGIPKEVHPGEHRVAATPETVGRLRELGYAVRIEAAAGAAAGFSDADYEKAGAEVAADALSLWGEADIILKVRPPERHPALKRDEADLLRENGVLVSFIRPAAHKDLLEKLAARRATVLAMDLIPRITRAQKMDALSSMANLAGYRAVIEAANASTRYFMGQVTAAGKIAPAKVLIIGAGVAGLAAIGAARGLGAIVRAFDTRPAVGEQVRSMGAEFLEVALQEDGTGQGGYAKTMSPEYIKAEMELFAQQAAEVDVIITTALVPGSKAPVLITQAVVEQMKPGSVVVDLAAEQGGNCAVTRPGEVVVHQGVTIIGHEDLTSRMPAQASQLYGRNLVHFMEELGTAAQFNLDLQNEVIAGALVMVEGDLRWPPAPRAPAPAPEQAAGPKTGAVPAAAAPDHIAEAPARLQPLPAPGTPWGLWFMGLVGATLWVLIGLFAPREFLISFTVFVLACFIGWKVIWDVKPSLHTPLMSATNAVSGIIIIGGILQFADAGQPVVLILGAVAVLIASINVFGGFLVTHRMLKMFRR